MLHLPKIFKWIELYYRLHPSLGLGDEINGRKKGVLFMHLICMNSKKDYRTNGMLNCFVSFAFVDC